MIGWPGVGALLALVMMFERWDQAFGAAHQNKGL